MGASLLSGPKSLHICVWGIFEDTTAILDMWDHNIVSS